MFKYKNKIISLFLVILILISNFFIVNVSADTSAINPSGVINNQIKWEIDMSTKKLTISLIDGVSTAIIPNFSHSIDSSGNIYSYAPWNFKTTDFRKSITSVSIARHITEIGDYAFAGMTGLERVSAVSATIYGEGCFMDCVNIKSVNLPGIVSDEDADIVFKKNSFKNVSSCCSEKFFGIKISVDNNGSAIFEESCFEGSKITTGEILANNILIQKNSFKNADIDGLLKFGKEIGPDAINGTLINVLVQPAVIELDKTAFKDANVFGFELYSKDNINLPRPFLVNVNSVHLKCDKNITFETTDLSTPIFNSNYIDEFRVETFNNVFDMPEKMFSDNCKIRKLQIRKLGYCNKNNLRFDENNNSSFLVSESKDYSSVMNLSFLNTPQLFVSNMSSGIHRLAIENYTLFQAIDPNSFDYSKVLIDKICSDSKQSAIMVSWFGGKKCSSYMIQRKGPSDEMFYDIGNVPFYENSFTDNTALPNKFYTYRVKTNYKDLNGVFSDEVSYVLMNLSSNLSSDGIEVTVKQDMLYFKFKENAIPNNSGITGFDIYVDNIKITTVNLNDVISSGEFQLKLPGNIIYGKEYKIKAVPFKEYQSGKYAYGNPIEKSYTPTVQLLNPTIKCINSGNGKVKVSWNKVTNASTYLFKVYDEKNNEILNKEISKLEYSHEFNLPGKYIIKVFSKRDLCINNVGSSVSLTIMLSAKPTLNKTINKNSISLTWNNIIGANQYLIERKEGTDNWKVIKEFPITTNNYTDPNLLYGQKYSYRIRAKQNKTEYSSSDLYTEYSSVIEFIPTIILEKTNLKIIEDTNNSVTLSWDKVPEANKYCLYYRKSTDNEFVLLTECSDTKYKHDNLKDGESFMYIVKAKRDYAVSDKESNMAIYVTLSHVATKLSASLNKTQVSLTWDEVIGASGYKVYRMDKEGSFNLIKTVAENNFTDSITELIEYKYKIIPFKTLMDKTEYTKTESNIVSLMYVPDLVSPELKIDKLANGSFKLSWTKPEYMTSYNLYKKEGDNGWVEVFKEQNISEFIDTAVVNGKTYQYKIRANCYNIDFRESDIVSQKFDLTIIPGKIQINQKNATIEISYDSNYKNFEIYRKTNNEDWVLVLITGKTSFIDKVVRDRNYEYKVRAYEPVSDGNYYSDFIEFSSVRILQSVNGTRANLKITLINNSKVSLSWMAISGAEKYEIYRKIDNKKWSLIKTVTKTSFLNNKLKQGTKYSYRIVPISSFDKGNYSNIVSVTTLNKERVKLRAKRNKTSIELNWNKAKGAAGYEVFIATSKKPKFQKYKNTKSNKVIIKNINKNIQYYITVRSYKMINGKKVIGKKSLVAIV